MAGFKAHITTSTVLGIGYGIGGYFYLQVAGMDEAVAIAQQCPGLDYGAVVEVRPVAEMCMTRARAMESATSPAELSGAPA